MAAPYGNKNAEVWNEKDSTELFQKSLELSKDNEYDFIGEIARELGVYRELYDYLSEKFPSLSNIHKTILSNLEANCFSHAKKGKIKEATAIVNLKSNYNWKDKSEVIQNTNITVNKELEQLLDAWITQK